MPDVLVDQPTRRPTRKNERGGLAAAMAVVAVAVLQQGFGWEVSPELASAVTALLGFGVAYVVRDREQ